ncbi:hypothetical protein EMIHUDRAFT_432449, partial [Emiliania huxleyi CCMP1516]|uniref:Uncharacterized protein n=2 Tax=Emiliania huxleyi TaxID=2903 RepID=A0A0D3IT94_EMIH1
MDAPDSAAGSSGSSGGDSSGAASSTLRELVGFAAFCLLPLYVAGSLLYPMRVRALALPRRLFACSFSLSLCLLLLVLLDVGELLSATTRAALWRASLLAHLSLLVLWLPLAQIALLLRRTTGVSVSRAPTPNGLTSQQFTALLTASSSLLFRSASPPLLCSPGCTPFTASGTPFRRASQEQFSALPFTDRRSRHALLEQPSDTETDTETSTGRPA